MRSLYSQAHTHSCFQIKQLTDEADANSDGLVSRDEFVQFCSHHQEVNKELRETLFSGISDLMPKEKDKDK